MGDPLGPHVLQVSVQAPAVLLQYPCVSPTAQKKQPVRTHTQDRHPLKALGLQQKPSVGLFPVKNYCIIILQATREPKAVSSPACVRVRGEALVSVLRPESLHRPVVDLGGWGVRRRRRRSGRSRWCACMLGGGGGGSRFRHLKTQVTLFEWAHALANIMLRRMWWLNGCTRVLLWADSHVL